jgi:hypothetical protein
MSNTQVICQAVAITGVKCQWPIMSQSESETARQLGKMDLGGGSRRGAKEARGERCGKGAYLRELGEEREKKRERRSEERQQVDKKWASAQAEAVMVG